MIRKFIFIMVMVSSFPFTVTFGQSIQTPFIKHYNMKSGVATMSWEILLDSNKNVLVANYFGIDYFNGLDWKRDRVSKDLSKLPMYNILRKNIYKEHSFILGGIFSSGFIERKADGFLFIKVIEETETKQVLGGHLQEVFQVEKQTIFLGRSLAAIVYDHDTRLKKQIKGFENKSVFKYHLFRKKIIAQAENGQLFWLTKDSWKPIKEPTFFKKYLPPHILLFKNIGAGQAGPSLSAHLAAKGEKVAIVEGHKFGGTCVNYGCTPTKTLVASARAAHMARRGGDFGVMISGDIQIDMKKVKARKDEQVNKSNKGVENWLKNTPNLDVYEAYARFESANTLRVGEELLQADQIFINVGGYPRVSDDVKNAEYLTNRTILDLEEVPEHLIVVGGSYIGLEFGQMYRRFGSKVTIIEMGERLVKREDEDVSLAIHDILEKENITLRLTRVNAFQLSYIQS